MEEENGCSLRLKDLSRRAVDQVERAMKELDMDFQKGELLHTGLVDTGRLRQVIQSIKDLKDIWDEGEEKKDASSLYLALKQEEAEEEKHED